MVRRFSSRDVALSEALAKQKPGLPVPRPRGIRYNSFDDIYRVMSSGSVSQWTYPALGGSFIGTTVLLSIRDSKWKDFTILSEHDGGWYPDYPPQPYPLYQLYEWANKETVYVCQGEASVEAVETLELAATTCLGGPAKARLSDWSPLKGKHVAVLRNLNAKGRDYGESVSQFCLGAGAHSARIVILPELQEDQTVAMWLTERLENSTIDQMRVEIERAAALAEPVEYIKPPVTPLEGPQADLKRLSEFAIEPMEWVFDGVVPKGSLTLLTGEPGIGKSLILDKLLKAITLGDRGPHLADKREPGAVILFSPEENLARTICPRLREGGADLANVYALCGVREFDGETRTELAWSFQLERDLPILEAEILRLKKEGVDLRLVAIDPVDCYSGPSRGAGGPTAKRLAELAADTGVAIVVVSHWSALKGESRGLSRLIRHTPDNGSYAAAAQSVWVVLPHLDDLNGRLVLPIKTSQYQSLPGLSCFIEKGFVEWAQEPFSMTMDEYLTLASERPGHLQPAEFARCSKLSLASDWLQHRLKDGDAPALDVIAEAKKNGISLGTLRRAKDQLECASTHRSNKDQWDWSLPIPKSGVDPNVAGDMPLT